jgi:hypothetical protein
LDVGRGRAEKAVKGKGRKKEGRAKKQKGS